MCRIACGDLSADGGVGGVYPQGVLAFGVVELDESEVRQFGFAFIGNTDSDQVVFSGGNLQCIGIVGVEKVAEQEGRTAFFDNV